ncbi:aspartate kinase [Desulforamulus reducens MI-1]|uniref:Aspartokinase n=1 Tax=Desulforamulus reducens (strain ATCC BAA-1160 / DSM 100696 / MI-1) TaxID=349161 RepID=A4J3P8_DESRM|nr:aspartate kinase [Desulforamulus reducens]ABO49701.1 aspartate kinase [Desulforamulus reducens MI-1]
MLVVKKFGGSSVADPERIKRVARRVVEEHQKGNQVVVTVSAMGDTTDDLVSLAKQVTNDPSEREMDMLLSTGEQISIALLSMAIRDLGSDVISLTGGQVGIYTDDVHSKAKILKIETSRVKEELEQGRVVVVAGFQGIKSNHDITTLGRGGSDTTAVALAAALKADICEIFTDVDGVYTTDPRLVPEASKLKNISFDEMLELASLGAQVLHPRSVELAKQYGIPIHVRTSFDHREGTIVEEAPNMENAPVVSGVAHDYNVAKIGLFDVPDQPGVAKKIFKALSKHNLNVDMIIQSAMRNNMNDIGFTTTQDDLRKALQTIEAIQQEVGFRGYNHDEDVAKVSIVGAGMISHPGVAADMFEALADEGINLEMITTSEIKVSCVIKRSETEKAVKALHKKFKLDNLAEASIYNR